MYFTDFMLPEEFPDALKRQLEEQQNKEEQERKQRELDKSTCKVMVVWAITFFTHPTPKSSASICMK